MLHYILLLLISSLTAQRPSFFYPETRFETFGRGKKIHHLSSSVDLEDYHVNLDIGYNFLLKKLDLHPTQLGISNSFQDHKGVVHVYASHVYKGVPIANHKAQAHINLGKITSFSTSFTGQNQLHWRPKSHVGLQMTEELAGKIAHKSTGIPVHSYPIKTVILQDKDGFMVEVFVVQLKGNREWLEVYVDTFHGKIIQVVDFKSKATYSVLPWTIKNPEEGGFSLVTDPQYPDSSPYGWHSDGQTNSTNTHGNNVHAFKYGQEYHGEYYVEGGESLKFDNFWNSTADPAEERNANASATNLFYIANMMHDLTYQYGFTEAAGNFQQDNFGKGGLAGDAVEASAQDPDGTDNAYFYSPPDGQNGILAMFIFDMTDPRRDGALDNAIPIHEYTHGVSTRLTGGADDPHCLQSPISSGMGEGWSDAMAMFIQRKEKETRHDDVVMGAWTLNRTQGIRSLPYSTNMSVNPLRYSDLNEKTEAHQIGEIWASILNEMYWNLVEKYGRSSNLFDASQPHGNIVALQVMIGGMMLQPCNPNFIDGRDAILQADMNYYNGKHQCEIWAAFAKRGTGVDADTSDSFAVPETCGQPVFAHETIDLKFNADFTTTQNLAIKKGSYVRLYYDLKRLGVPCADFEICTFMNQDKPECRKLAYRPEQLQTSFLVKDAGKLNIYVRTWSPNPYNVPYSCEKIDSNFGKNWQFDVVN